MKQLLVFCMLGAFGAVIAGCEASAKVGDTDDRSGTVVKKESTTVREPNGTVRSRTEVKQYDR